MSFFGRPGYDTPLAYEFKKSTVELITKAQNEGTDVIYHGGCHGCIFLPGNNTTAGIMHCHGCSYSQWDKLRRDLRVGL